MTHRLLPVEMVACFAARCECGWVRVMSSEADAAAAAVRHYLQPCCSACTSTDPVAGSAELQSDVGDRGAFCADCLPHYA